MAEKFDYGFRDLSAPFVSASQSARVRTEDWVAREMYCPACGERALRALPNNSPVGDFACESCREEYELKFSMKAFGPKVVDGAYETMIARLEGQSAPNLLLMRYDKQSSMVIDVEAIPSQFFTPRIIERRKPLAPPRVGPGGSAATSLSARFRVSGAFL
jgi:type II restriction enzyme